MAGDAPSMESFLEKINVKLKSTFIDLHKIWQEIGFSEQAQSECRKQAYEHLEGLLDDMVAETENQKKELLHEVEMLLSQAAAFNKELGTKMNTAGYEFLPLHELRQSLRSYMQDLQHQKEQRLSYFKQLRSKERDICKYLGVQPINIDAEIPSEEALNNFEIYLEKQEEEKNRLENIFQEMRRSVVKMMDDLGIMPSLNFEHTIYSSPENFIYTNSNMVKLRELRDQLQIQVEEAKTQAEEMRRTLISLWKYLDEPDHVCERFLDSYSDYSVRTMDALNAEIKRCKEKRRENLAKHVSHARSELVKLWDLCKYGETQRSKFVHFTAQMYTEDLLTLHDMEAERLRQYYESNREIFDLLDERERLMEKIRELMQRVNNPERFHNRGGQLLLEEKERKVIQRQLPKIEEKLKELTQKYEETHNEPFTINGVTLENLLAESWVTLNMEKQTIKKAKKDTKDKSAKKTGLSASKLTPGLSNTRRTPHNPTSKRKLPFHSSPNSSAKRRNTSGGKNRLGVTSSKIRRSGSVPRRQLLGVIEKKRRSKSDTSTADTTYTQFQEHLKERTELRSSMLPEAVLKSANKSNTRLPVRTPLRTPVRTPVKPMRKNLSTPTNSTMGTPKFGGRKQPHSPRTLEMPRLATAPNVLPNIF